MKKAILAVALATTANVVFANTYCWVEKIPGTVYTQQRCAAEPRGTY